MMGKVVERFKDIDILGEPIQLKVKGRESYTSIFGALISLGIFTTVAAYGVNKFTLMKEKGDTIYHSRKEINRDADYNDIVGLDEHKYNVAFSLLNSG